MVQAVREAIKLLGLCCLASEMISDGRLLHAHQGLIRIRNEHFQEWQLSTDKARSSIL